MSKTHSRGWGQFVALPENESALAAGRLLVRCFGERKRPPFDVLYVYGEPGSGKTLLVTALAERVTGTVVLSAWDFAKTEYARDFAAPTLVIFEDVNRLPPDAAERLVAVLNARASRRHVTVVTGSESPFDLKVLPRRLTTRLGGGLTVAIRPYGLDSREHLLKRLSVTQKWNLSDHALASLVAESKGGVRELISDARERATTRRRYRARDTNVPRPAPGIRTTGQSRSGPALSPSTNSPPPWPRNSS